MYDFSLGSLSRSFRDKPCRAVIYGRASTEHEAQVKALENQMQWYDDVARYHPQWNIIKRYIDQGITGTQVYKRDAFMEMLEDAKKHKFDLVVTREVCRFARNTVDALVCVRQLAAMGIEVYFVNDNIWTLDGDGELRLTIMATMAQEESRKISERSRAGQRVSREKGVVYGTGNIFGYSRNKLTKQFEIDPEQAETVKMIFDLYDSGMGGTLVAKELTRLGRKNGVGEIKWDAAKISKIIKRKNYLGYTVYGQSYSNNYLEQKRIKRDESEFICVKGGFPQIISDEQFARCNSILRGRSKLLRDASGRVRGFGTLRAQNVKSDVMSYLRNEGYAPSYDEDGDVKFKVQGYPYYGGYRSYSTPINADQKSEFKTNRHGYYTCPNCHGSGRCPHCSHGIARNPYLGGDPMICGVCHGKGECQSCDGTGKVYGVIH